MEHRGTKIIETERLILRPFKKEDAGPMFENWASDPEVTKFLTWPTHESVEVTGKVVESWVQRNDNPMHYQWAIELKEIHEPIGSISAVNIDARTRTATVGYCIGRRWWGQGITPEALEAVIAFFFDQVCVNRINACHDPRNPNSGKVMKKCGMTFEGTWRQGGVNNQGVCDESWYSILRTEYENKKHEWWKHAVVYQIYPKSFRDSNGDGMGDLKGITERLPYLKELGVNVLWLCPIYKSPMDDGGYDIADYYHVDPMFGTDQDLDELMDRAGKMGIKILMDLVINHTSDEHAWFQEALKEPDGRYGDYYIFKETEDGTLPNNWRSYFGGPAWERIGDTNRFYLHAFSRKQPDLNWENEEVREELYRMVNYWLDKGLGGFRIDAISNIKKHMEYGIFSPDGEDGLRYIGDWILNQPGIETFLGELSNRTFRLHNSMTVAESDVPDELLHRFIGEEGFFSMVFDFTYTDIDLPDTGEWFRAKPFTVRELRDKLFHSQLMVQEKGWGAVYLENHDQNRSVNKYIPMEDRNDYSKTMLGCLFLMLRGTPFIYQGQEIGMENIPMDSLEEYDDIATKSQYARALEEGMSPKEALAVVNHRSRDNSRTPMQWDDSENAGFSPAGRTWLKVNPNYKNINAKQQMEDPKSVLNFYKKLIALRKDSPYAPLIVDGRFIPYETEDDSVIAYERAGDGESLLVILNFQNKDSVVKAPKGYGKKVIGNYDRDFCPGEEYSLRPYECVVLWKGEYGQGDPA